MIWVIFPLRYLLATIFKLSHLLLDWLDRLTVRHPPGRKLRVLQALLLKWGWRKGEKAKM